MPLRRIQPSIQLEPILAADQTRERKTDCRRSQEPKMKRPITIAFAFALLARVAVAVVPDGWSTNFDAALEDAGKRQQPMLVYFTASWCGPCKFIALTT